jgi:hypothetical protein
VNRARRLNMSTAEEPSKEHGAHEKTIEVTVTFPLAKGQPYHDDKVAPETTVGAVREAAMAHFGIQPEPNTTYFLTHDGAPVADATTVGTVAGKAGAVKFTLVKELIQG